MAIRTKRNKVVVKLPKTEEATSTGLLIPESAQKPPMEGIVFSVGERVEGVRVKDRVLFDQCAGLEYVDKDWGEVLILESSDLIMVANMD